MSVRRLRSTAPLVVALVAGAALAWFTGPASPKAFAAPRIEARGVAPATLARSPVLWAAARAGALRGCRGSRACLRAVGLFYGTQTGNTEEVAGVLGKKAGVDAQDWGDLAETGELAGYDGLIVGAPTWNTDADEYRSGTSFDDYLDEIKGLDLGGKPVAVFGCGDSSGYGDNFCDAIEEIHSAFEAAGAKMIGYTDASGYTFEESKSVKDGKFLGLPLDQDNEGDMTEERAEAWISQIKAEGMPL